MGCGTNGTHGRLWTPMSRDMNDEDVMQARGVAALMLLLRKPALLRSVTLPLKQRRACRTYSAPMPRLAPVTTHTRRCSGGFCCCCSCRKTVTAWTSPLMMLRSTAMGHAAQRGTFGCPATIFLV